MFNTRHNPEIGVAEPLAEGLQVVTAPNASPMTFTGTRSYILGESDVAVIDPGPLDPAHLEALVAALHGRRVSHILVTHSHKDHSPLAKALSRKVDAPVFGFGPSGSGMSAVMRGLSELGGGEGVDETFRPDVELSDGEVVSGNGWSLEAVHTPGHMSNHLCFAWQNALFSGDHVMGWSTTLVSPPDGDLTQFMQSMHRLSSRSETTYYPGHGDVLHDAPAMLAYQIAHRKSRESQIIAALPGRVEEITKRVYTELDARLLPMAARNVFAHLVNLCERDVIRAEAGLSFSSYFRVV